MVIGDEQLMLETAKGSLPAFEMLVRRWDRRMLSFFYRCTRQMEEAQDLRQELFLRVYQNCTSFRQDGNFQAWLYRIATNLVIDKVARKQKQPSYSIDDENAATEVQALASNDSVSGRIEENRMDRILKRALECLPQDQKMALIMRHFEHLTFTEIAQILNEPESTIKTRVYRGLNALRGELKKLGLLEQDCLQAV